MRSTFALLLCAAAMAAASGARFTLDDADVYKLVAASRKAPLISTRSLRSTEKPRNDLKWMPAVLMHGLGDSGSNPGMQSLAKSVAAAYPGMYSVSVDVANGFDSYVTPMWQQVDEFAAVVQSDPNLAGGFNAAGLSQGGPVVRGYIEKYNNPPVHNFVSICGVQGGEFDCPLEFQKIPLLCDTFLKNPYDFLEGLISLSFSDYWVESMNMTRYYAENKFLVPLNNQQRDPSAHNATFKANFKSLNHLVLIEALNDTVIYPAVSEQFGGYIDGSLHTTYNFTTWAPYTSDSFGLRSLHEAGKVTLGSFVGDHLQFSAEYWNTNVLPWFNTTMA